MDNLISVKRLSEVDEVTIAQVNALLDVGVVWDSEQGCKFLNNTDNALFLAYIDNNVVGFATAHRLQRFDQRRAEILLYEISVIENMRQKGVGKMLIENIKHWGKEVGADEVWVLSNKSNTAATALYQSIGGKTENPDDAMYVFKL